MRPPMLAGPMERASSPPKVLESISTSAARAVAAPAARPAIARQRIDFTVRCIHVLPGKKDSADSEVIREGDERSGSPPGTRSGRRYGLGGAGAFSSFFSF